MDTNPFRSFAEMVAEGDDTSSAAMRARRYAMLRRLARAPRKPLTAEDLTASTRACMQLAGAPPLDTPLETTAPPQAPNSGT